MDSSLRSHRWLERLLLLIFLLCLVVGLGALALFFAVRNSARPSLNVDPLRSVRVNLIDSSLALRQLSGDPAAALAAQTMQAGYLETARAILTFATDISPVERSARLSHLARAYLAAGQRDAAAQIYAQVISAAILEDAIPLTERVHLLKLSADGLHKTGFEDAAVDAATQALRIAVQAPGLLPAQRSALFNDLRAVVEQFDRSDPAVETLRLQLRDYVRNPYLTGAGLIVTPTLATFPQQIAYDSLTQEKIAARQQAARILADRIAFTGGVDIEPERQALAQALLEEDQARTHFYQNPGELSREQQLWLWLDHRAWLVEKARIALQGYGISLLPQWESELDGILNRLNADYVFLNSLMTAFVVDRPTTTEQRLLQVESHHWAAAQAMRGLYPNAPTDDIGELLRGLQEELRREGTPLALPVIFDPAATPPGFRIQPAP
ncbi:MAG: hypothetical protein NZ553_05900 [Caldilinea sp.]|nr:hypothetical protein [Caldilinea sp.]MDW8439992.1 hypothetical protein [Caldilineaceae bacterium]